MRTTGKVTQEWLKTRREWIKLHPPNHQGYYVCWKGDWVKAEEMELDHIENRSTNPEKRNDFDNLRPSCHKHNFGRKA